jgi:hypothetical protein
LIVTQTKHKNQLAKQKNQTNSPAKNKEKAKASLRSAHQVDPTKAKQEKSKKPPSKKKERVPKKKEGSRQKKEKAKPVFGSAEF